MRLLKRGTWSAQYSSMKSTRETHPLDVIEFTSELHHVEYDRPSRDEFYFFHDQDERQLEESLIWYDQCETLTYTCSIDLIISPEQIPEIQKLVSRINAHLLAGHFDLIAEENMITFRYGLLLHGGLDISSQQCAALLDMGPKICATHHQAFMLVANSHITAEEAMDIAVFDVAGRA